jgi:outer membrane protein
MAAEKPDASKTDWNYRVGAGAIYAPAFVGSKDYQLMAFPDLKIEYKDKFFASVGDGIGYNVINSNGWRVGPIVKYAFQRQENGKNPFRVAGKSSTALRGLGDVDGTMELGGFVEYNYEPITTKVEIRQGVDGHEGMIGDVSLSYGNTYMGLGPPIIYSFGPRATFADSDYNNAYFGINQTQSTRSGLARYNADSGLVSYGVGAFALLPVTDSVSVSTFAGYDRLGAEVTDSPLIKERGSENQFVAGMTVSYQFGY